MEVLFVVAMAASFIACFLVGAKVGQAVSKGETIKLAVNPKERYEEHQAKKEAQAEQDRYNTIMRNIENYDGTSIGQQEVR